MRRIACLLVTTSIACSSGANSAPGPSKPAPSPTTPDAVPAPVTPTRAECEAMVMHIAELALAEQGSAASGDREQVAASLQSFTIDCASQPPELVRCVTAAKTTAEAQGCSHDAK